MSNKDEKKKILLYTRPIAPPWDEASKNLAWELAKNCQNDFEFHVLTTKKLPLEKQDKKIVLEPIFSSPAYNFSAKIRMLLRLFEWNLNADVIHFLFTPRPLTSFFIKMRLFFSKVKTVQTVATIKDGFYKNPRKIRKILFGDKIIAQSRYTFNKLASARLKNVKLIYPAIDLEKFQPAPKDSQLMNLLNLDTSDIVLLFAAEYTKISGIGNVIRAFEILHKNYPLQATNYKLIIACRIKNQADREKKIEVKNGLENTNFGKNIIFMESVMDIAKLYNISDINLFTVNEMTGKFDIPFVMIEAMACAKPLIVSDLPILGEFVKNGYNGLVAEGNKPENIAECIKKLSDDFQLRNKLGQNALEYARKNFDIKKTAKKYEEIYNAL